MKRLFSLQAEDHRDIAMHKPLPFLAAAFAALTLVAAPAQVSAQAADCNPAVVQ